MRNLYQFVVLILICGCAYGQAQVVQFIDPGLEKRLRVVLEKPEGEITVEEMKGLKLLNASGRSIRSIQGLEYAVNLWNLSLRDNLLSDVNVLGALGKLQSLNLSGNKIRNLDFLNDLTNLRILDLGNNEISDASFPHSMNRLYSISLYGNPLDRVEIPETFTQFDNIKFSDRALPVFSSVPAGTRLWIRVGGGWGDWYVDLSGIKAVFHPTVRDALRTESGFSFTFHADGGDYSVQRSTDLISWTEIATISIPEEKGSFTHTGAVEFADESPPSSQVFYRVKSTNLIPSSRQDFTIPGLELEMVAIPDGNFIMGAPSDEIDSRQDQEGPQTEVTISNHYWLGKFEVTQGQWEKIMDNNPSNWHDDPHLPVELVSWYQAIEFCDRLNEMESVTERIPEGYEFNLPTEAQWEYACRAGTRTRFHYGDDLNYELLGDYAWYDLKNDRRTNVVGSKLPNFWGLYDMYGNVKEWCLEISFWNYPGGKATDLKGHPDVSGGDGTRSWMTRGGSWSDPARGNRSASRDSWRGNSADLGFRVALVPIRE